MLPLPDLLHPRPHAGFDPRLLEEVLEVSFLGGDAGGALDEALDEAPVPASPWNPDHFAAGLFLDEMIEDCFRVVYDARRYPIHRRYLRRVLGQPPVDPETIRFRQEVLRELDERPELRERARRLHRELFDVAALFRAPGESLRIDQATFRLDLLQHVRAVIDSMARDFAGARSGLRRLHEVAEEIRAGHEYRLLAELLDHEGRLADLSIRVRLGADGRIRRLTVGEMDENAANRFHRRPARRWLDRALVRWRGYDLDRREVVNRLIVAVYHEISPALRTVLQVLGQLEVYLGALAFAERSRAAGLDVCLADLDPGGRLTYDELFNPLLLADCPRPTPCAIATDRPAATLMVTGPNSGGKTRMLQAVGLAQLLGQSGLFVPARSARLPVVQGLFVSLIEPVTAHQSEGRLGSELARIRRLFEEVHPRSLVLLDELCSGTNPSEAVEIVAVVLDLLRVLEPVAFVTTHFLDFARSLAERPAAEELSFLRTGNGADGLPTYRFDPGIADTSLAADTARRLGVTFGDLAELLNHRFGARVEPRFQEPSGDERPRRLTVAAGRGGTASSP